MFSYDWSLKDLNNVEKNGLKVFSCFSCGGGSSMGYKLAGFDVVGNVEIDPRVNCCYVENLNPTHNYLMDIREFRNLEILPAELFELDILDGSPPCSLFSRANLTADAKKSKKGEIIQGKIKNFKVKKLREKKCKNCKIYFAPERDGQIVCNNMECAVAYAKVLTAKKKRQLIKAYRGSDKSLLKKQVQALANKYGRMRDLASNRNTCVTCNQTANKYDGGHCFPTSTYPAIRYYTTQIGMQCVNCNQYNGGRPVEYEAYLRIKLGDEKVNWMKSQHRISRSYTEAYLIKYLRVMRKRLKKVENKLNKF